ncbi:MAG: hypothetical protein AAF437_03320 [Pseudomonadota bacterium]
MIPIRANWRIISAVALLFLLLFLGFILAWPSWFTGLYKQDQGFLQNLLSEGVGVAITTIIIAPLTALFVEKRREKELVPIRRQFFSDVTARLDEAAFSFNQSYLHFFSTGTHLKQLALLDDLNQLSFRVTKALQPDKSLTPDDSANERLETAARSMAGFLTDISNLTDDLESIERLIEIYTPMLSAESISQVAKISASVRREITSFRTLKKYLEGRASSVERLLAQNASLDVSLLMSSLSVLLRETGHEDLIKTIQNRQSPFSISKQKETLANVSEVIDKIYYREILENEQRRD